MSASGLAAALAAHGLACRIETHDTLAVLVPRDGTSRLAAPEHRELAVRLAREHGFTHIAVELSPAHDTA